MILNNYELCREFATTIERPFELRYDPHSQSVEVLDNTKSISKMIDDIKDQLTTVSTAVNKLRVKPRRLPSYSWITCGVARVSGEKGRELPRSRRWDRRSFTREQQAEKYHRGLAFSLILVSLLHICMADASSSKNVCLVFMWPLCDRLCCVILKANHPCLDHAHLKWYKSGIKTMFILISIA